MCLGQAVQVRLATFNIRHGRRPDGQVDAALLASACASLGADVLALQEVDRFAARSHGVDQAELVAQKTGMAMAFGASLSFPSGWSYGNALLVRGEIDDWQLHRLPRVWGSERRTALAAEVEVDGARLGVVVTHLSVHGLEARWQLRRVLAIADHLASAAGRPVVVLGDLNLTRGRVQPAARRHRMLAVASGPTFPAEAPWRQIDLALVPIGGELPRTVVRRLPVSDHLAVIVQIGQE